MIIALVALIAVIAVAIYAFQQSTQLGVGVKAGDVFTYKITGTFETSEEGTSAPDSFTEINKIDYCRIEIKDVNFPLVSYTETTQYKNGTIYNYDSTININSGVNTYESGFWGIYVTGLTKNSLSRPDVPEGARINNTETRTYRDGDRQTLFIQAENTYIDIDDESLSRQCLEYTYIHIDQQLGILVELTDMNIYTEPQIILTLKWELIDSNVLQIK